MVVSIDPSFAEKEYALNHFWSKRISDGKILVTTDHGDWVILSEDEFDLLLSGRVKEDPALFKVLEDKGVILTRENLQEISRKYSVRYRPAFTGPTLHILAVTLRCNHKCIYCAQLSRGEHAKEYDMDFDTAKKVLEFVFSSPSRFLTIEFQGGEPLLNFEIVQYVIEEAKKIASEKRKRLFFNLVSNFTLLDEEIAEYLIQNRVNVNTSLDGPKELHDKQRRYKKGSSYEAAVQGISIFREKNYRISALPTVTRYSFEYYKEIVNEYIKQGFNSVRMRELNFAGFAHSRWKEIGYTAEEYIEVWKKYIEYVISLNRKGIRFWDQMIQILLFKTIKGINNYACWGAPCGAAFQQVAYNYNGDIHTCDESRSFPLFKIGNVKENTFQEVYTSPNTLGILDISSQLSSLCENCVYRPFCGPCPVWTYGSQGHLICKLPENMLCKIRKFILTWMFEALSDREKRKILLSWIGLRRSG